MSCGSWWSCVGGCEGRCNSQKGCVTIVMFSLMSSWCVAHYTQSRVYCTSPFGSLPSVCNGSGCHGCGIAVDGNTPEIFAPLLYIP